MNTKTCRYVTDYTSNPYWGDYVNNFDNRDAVASAHPGGAQVLMADGSIHLLNETMEFALLRRLAIRDSGLTKKAAE